MIYFFLGNEINIVKEKINNIINELDIPNVIKYDFTETSINEIIEEVNYVDLFGERKLIIVSDFSFKKLKEKEENILKDYINHQNDNVIIFRCIDDTLDERKALIKLIKEKCDLIKCEKLDYKTLSEYVTNMFKEEKIQITFNQVKKILDYCEYNTDITINEVKKLLLYKMGETTITDKEIDLVISKNPEKELFNLNEHILNRNISACLESYRILSSSNVEEVVIIDSIAKQMRMLYQVIYLHSQMSYADIAKELKVKPFVIKKLIPYTKSYNEKQIIDILYKLSEIDSDIKLKGYDKTKVMESFLLTI